MPASFRTTICICLVIVALCGRASAQAAIDIASSAVPNLGRLSQSSAYIFSGTVTAVTRSAATPGTLATVLISFRVEQAVRGVRSGQTLTIREWAGLWDTGERYRPGERVMLFLYPPSRAGLTSPVGGPQGRFSVDSHGQILLPPARVSALSTAPVSATGRPPTGTAISARSFARAVQNVRKE